LSVRALLVGPSGHGGEGVYVRTLADNPPPEVAYAVAGSFHQGAPGASPRRAMEVALNRLIRPLTIPDIGIRALRIRDRFDLIHVHAHPNRLARIGDTPLVMSEGSSSAVYLGEYLGWDEGRMDRAYRRTRRVYRALGINDRLLSLQRVSVAYVFSEWARQVNLRWGADPAKLSVLPPGFPVPDPPCRRSSSTFEFLFVGTDFERKGGFDVVEAFGQIAGDHPGARLTVVGPDPHAPSPDPFARSWVEPKRRERALTTLERLEREDLIRRRALESRETLLQELYPRADAFVMPSLAEGFGFTNVEAMSMGLPVITSDVGPMPEAVEDGETGILVPPGDVEALSEAMSRLASNPDSAVRMGAAGRESFLERFTIDRFRAGLGAIYRRALER
jgi:glycosyltransferase involved in cell wall biosynthesis